MESFNYLKYPTKFPKITNSRQFKSIILADRHFSIIIPTVGG